MSKSGGKKNTPAKPTKRFVMSFTFTGVLSLGAAFVVIASLFFVLGLLVGRGYRPETMLPPLAEIMPSANASDKDAAQVLRPEDLDYRERLAADEPKGHGGVTRAKPKPKPKPEPVIERAVRQARAEAVKPAVAAPEPAPRTQAAEPDQDGGVYDYVYQVAAFKELAMAEELKDKIARQGLGSGLEQVNAGGAVWHRVMVYFQGHPEDTRDMRAKLARLGIDKVIMRDKKPVSR